MSFEHLQKGDTVALIIGDDCKIATVEKVNKVTLVADGKKFYRDSGYQQSDGWRNWYLATVEDGLKHQVYHKEQKLINTAKQAIKAMGLSPSVELVHEIVGIIKREKAAQRSESGS